MKRSYKTLVLNGDWVPMAVKSWQNAIVLILKEKVIEVDFYPDDYILAGHGKRFPIPSIVALKQYIRRDYSKVTFNKTNLLIRDSHQCQYCGEKFKSADLTLDHVIPKSKWTGKATSRCWTNIVAACYFCNRKKADRTCAESGMYPLKAPVQPSYDEIFFNLYLGGKIETSWIPYLKNFNSFKNL